jgi:hypothetical protein
MGIIAKVIRENRPKKPLRFNKVVQASCLLSLSRAKRQTKYSSYLISIPKLLGKKAKASRRKSGGICDVGLVMFRCLVIR